MQSELRRFELSAGEPALEEYRRLRAAVPPGSWIADRLDAVHALRHAPAAVVAALRQPGDLDTAVFEDWAARCDDAPDLVRESLRRVVREFLVRDGARLGACAVPARALLRASAVPARARRLGASGSLDAVRRVADLAVQRGCDRRDFQCAQREALAALGDAADDAVRAAVQSGDVAAVQTALPDLEAYERGERARAEDRERAEAEAAEFVRRFLADDDDLKDATGSET